MGSCFLSGANFVYTDAPTKPEDERSTLPSGIIDAPGIYLGFESAFRKTHAQLSLWHNKLAPHLN